MGNFNNTACYKILLSLEDQPASTMRHCSVNFEAKVSLAA